MSTCNRCSEDVGVDVIKCDGGCGRVYHYGCAGPPNKITVTKAFYKIFNENEYFEFYCTLCRKQTLKAINDKLNKVMSTIAIYDERVGRQEEQIKQLQESIEENKIINSESANNIKTGLKDIESFNGEIINKVDLMINRAHPKPVINKQMTIADIIKSGNTSSVIITPKNTKQESEKTKTEVKEKISPVDITVSGIRKVGKGAIVIDCTDTGSSKKLIKNITDNLSENYTVKQADHKKPRLKIIGMSSKETEENMVSLIKSQNNLDTAEINVLRVFQNRYKSFNCIIEVDGECFKRLMEEKKVFVGWDRCRVVECIDVLRCYNCSGFYHKADDCTHKKACPRCAEDHKLEDCKNTKLKCPNCTFAVNTMKLKLDTDHEAWSLDCPSLMRKLQIQRSKISYNQ